MEVKLSLAGEVGCECDTTIWNDVVNEAVQRKVAGHKTSLLNNNSESDEAFHKVAKKLLLKERFSGCKLGNKYGNIYFTKLETECMMLFLRGKTVIGVAMILGLSPGTAEYCLKKMKNKTGCRTKPELIEMVYESGFIKNVDFMM